MFGISNLPVYAGPDRWRVNAFVLMKRDGDLGCGITFQNRLLTACLSTLVAILWLLLFPMVAISIGNGFGGGGEFDLAGIIHPRR